MWSGDKDAFKPSKLALLKKKELLQQLTLRVNIFHCNVSLWTLSYTNSIDILSQPYSGVFSLDTEGGGDAARDLMESLEARRRNG